MVPLFLGEYLPNTVFMLVYTRLCTEKFGRQLWQGRGGISKSDNRCGGVDSDENDFRNRKYPSPKQIRRLV